MTDADRKSFRESFAINPTNTALFATKPIS